MEKFVVMVVGFTGSLKVNTTKVFAGAVRGGVWAAGFVAITVKVPSGTVRNQNR